MVFIVTLAQTHQHTPGREHSFQWSSLSVLINLIWLIMNLTWLLLLRHGFTFSLFFFHSSVLLDGDKGKWGCQKHRSDGKGSFLLVHEWFPTVFSLISIRNRFSWSCPFPLAFHMCEQWILVAAQLMWPSRLAPYIHHCAGKVAV